MSMLDELTQQAGGLDLGAIGAKFGLTPDQVQGAVGQLLPHIANPAVDNGQATANVAASTGIDASKLSGIVQEIVTAAGSGQSGGQGGVLGSIVSGLESQGGASSLLGSLSNILDRDGDGNPINDVLGMFGKK